MSGLTLFSVFMFLIVFVYWVRNLLRGRNPHPAAPEAQECIKMENIAHIWREEKKVKRSDQFEEAKRDPSPKKKTILHRFFELINSKGVNGNLQTRHRMMRVLLAAKSFYLNKKPILHSTTLAGPILKGWVHFNYCSNTT